MLIDALSEAGHDVNVASEFRSFCAAPDPGRQETIRAEGEAETSRLVSKYHSGTLPAPRVKGLWLPIENCLQQTGSRGV